ncbi:MAG: LIC12048 family lipoprotein [Leptospirales bacterium]
MNTLRIFEIFIKTPVRYLLFALIATTILGMNCSGKAPISLATETVDLSEEPIIAEPEPIDIFNMTPGESSKIGAYGVVDPVGTILADDFDGDGIINTKETVSNIWVSEYPMIETSIAPPVTMEIVILKDKVGQTNKLVNNISSSDFENRRNEGSDKFHQTEMNNKTVQYTKHTENSFGMELSVQSGPVGMGAGMNVSSKKTTDVFENKPFKNNIDRKASTVTSNAAQTKAREYRKEKRKTTDVNSIIEPNAGTIRAALYIKNNSVNMPVRLSNILCSLLFETSTGELIPMESFRLKNSDYSVFSIEVYGSSEFGPYVIELSGLNTVEIESAIAKGYTPKIYIVDYTMSHVADSNYQAALSSSFTGDNLKIIEENSKGRTSLIKMFGPFMREMFRVAAFTVDTDDPNDACSLTGPATTVTPGISMKKALERIACSGFDIQFDHYIFDFSDTPYEFTAPLFYTYTVKSVDGTTNQFPCHSQVQGTDINGNSATACLLRVADLTNMELDMLGMWAVFDSGKYFDMGRQVTDVNGDPVTFDGVIPMMEGLFSTIWAGDNYDLVFLSMSDVLGREKEFGSNPLETSDTFPINTRWDRGIMGDNPDYPDVNSTYLGQAGLGEQIEFTIELSNTSKLLPDFGLPEDFTSYSSYTGFSSVWQPETSKLFSIEEVFDFQIGFGLGGTREHWYNIARTDFATITDSNNFTDGVLNCGQSWSFLTQTFKVCIEIPTSLVGVGADEVVAVFLRPTPNNAYREIIWPKDYTDVNRFQGKVFTPLLAGDTVIETYGGIGDLQTGTAEATTAINVGGDGYTIASVEYLERVYTVNLQVQTTVAYSTDAPITVGTFNGKLKKDAAVGVTTLLVVPDTVTDILSNGAGKTASIGAQQYLVSSATLVANFHTITLESALVEYHAKSEEVSVSANLTSGQVQYVEDVDFISDWNADAVNAFTYTRPDFTTRLYDAAIGTCSYGIDYLDIISPACQGYPVSPLIANYIGAGGFENSWNDVSNYDTYLSTIWQPRAMANSSTNTKTVPLPVNDTHSTEVSLSPEMANWNGNVVTVWAESNGTDRDIVGLVIDPQTGASVGSKFAISTTTAGDQLKPYVAIQNDVAFIVWESSETAIEIRGRFVDLTNPAASNSDFIVSSSGTNDKRRARVFITPSNKALVAWDRLLNGGLSYDLHGRVYDMVTQLPTAGNFGSNVSDFVINTLTPSNQARIEGVQYDTNKVFLVWHDDSGGNYDIRGQFLNLDTETMLASEIMVSSSTTNDQIRPTVSASGNTAVVIWSSDDLVLNDINVRGIFIDLANEVSVGSDFLLHNSTANEQRRHRIKLGTNYGLACWRHENSVDADVKCRTIDIANRVLKGGSDLFFSTHTAGDQSLPNIGIVNDTAYVVWTSVEPTGWSYRTQVIDLKNNSRITKTDLLISDHIYTSAYWADTNGNHINPNTAKLITNGSTVVAVWANNDGLFSQRLVEQTLFPLPYGMNNFFVSPLLERTYSVRVRLLF